MIVEQIAKSLRKSSKPFVLDDNRFNLKPQPNRKESWMSPHSGKIHLVCEKCEHHNHAYLNGYNDKFPDGEEYIQGPVKHFDLDAVLAAAASAAPYVPGADEPPKREEPPPLDDDLTF